jgi:hypothetical protein
MTKLKLTIPDDQKARLVQALVTLLTVLLGIALTLGTQVVDQLVNPAGDVMQSLGTTHFTNVSAEDLTATDDLTVTDDASIGGAATITDDLAVGGDATVTGAVSAEQLTTTDDATVTDDLGVTGDTTIGGGLDVDGTSNLDDVDIDGVTNLVTGTEHIGLPSILSTAILSDTDGALWTIGDGEIWIIHNVYCHVTTNFDCDGDDCTLQIGDGSDPNGLLDLVDAELQTTDVDVANGAAGWQGYGADTIGAYLAAGAGFIYNPSGAAETIDVDIEDTSGSTDPSAGAATCYLVYTRVQ